MKHDLTRWELAGRGTCRVDWDQFHRRIQAAEAQLARMLNPSPDAQQAVLRTRARELARETPTRDAPTEAIEVVEFVLASEHFAIESRYIREIGLLHDLTPLPGAPAFVLGLINVRGEIFSVIDIKKFFELPEKGLTDLNKVIILQTSQMEFAILADAVIGMRSIPAQDLVISLPTLTGIRAEYLSGVTRDPMAILDAAQLLSNPHIRINQHLELT